MKIRPFGHSDVPQAKRLSDAAGWNQIQPDWHRIVDLEPEGCFGGWEDGQLVGTTTVVTYGRDLAWVGMVLVLPAHRGRGYGTALFRSALEYLDEREISAVGLDATDAGAKLYEQEGFSKVAPVTRWRGTLSPPSASPSRAEPVGAASARTIRRFDRRLTGIDRGRLLEHILNEPEGAGFAVRGEGEGLDGYLLIRPGRTAWQVGPLVATGGGVAASLLDAATRFLNRRVLVLDAVEGYGFAEVLEGTGLHPSRRLTRMSAPTPRPILTGPGLFAATGFEWG